jgi:translation initiation factor 2B subunit (eIF-2B alpha/beta/delta family)
MKEEIGKYAQGLRDNIEKNNRKNKQLISKKAKEIDKTKITLEDQQEKIQTAKKSAKADFFLHFVFSRVNLFNGIHRHGIPHVVLFFKVFIFRFASHQIL